MDLHHWLAFLPAAALVATSPGAGNFLAFTNGLRAGLAAAVAALVGRFTAFALLILAVIVGLDALLAASEALFTAIKWAGVAYLVWLAFRLWRTDSLPGGEAPLAASLAKLARREFWVAITNPKAMLLFTAFLPQFVDPSAPLAGQLVPLGAAYIAIEAVAATGYAFVGSRIKALELGARGARRVNRVTAGMMLGAAGWLAMARRGS